MWRYYIIAWVSNHRPQWYDEHPHFHNLNAVLIFAFPSYRSPRTNSQSYQRLRKALFGSWVPCLYFRSHRGVTGRRILFRPKVSYPCCLLHLHTDVNHFYARYGKTNMLWYISVCSMIGGISVSVTTGLGAAIVETARGDNQVCWFPTSIPLPVALADGLSSLNSGSCIFYSDLLLSPSVSNQSLNRIWNHADQSHDAQW